MEDTELENEIIKRERLGSCEVCDKNQAKYTCPKCEVKTCCLNCSKIHKKELECDGVRDKIKYIPIKKMTTMDFMNDYYFLEEATRFTSEMRKNRNVKAVKKRNARFIKLKKAMTQVKVKSDSDHHQQKQTKSNEPAMKIMKNNTGVTSNNNNNIVDNDDDEYDEIEPRNYFF